ncbi:MAG: segregation and condensation protein A [Patescibacteria group bacterium]
MVYHFKTEQFEGPLDLLLQLIEQEQLDITQVSLAAVTDQYIAHLNDAIDIPTDELADFLVVAAKLLLIKSRQLLPQLTTDDEDEGIDLEFQLKMYKEFYEASKVLHRMLNRKKFLFPRQRMLIKVDKVFNPPPSLSAALLRELFAGVLQELAVWVGLPQEQIARTVSIRERIINIQNLIQAQAQVQFSELLKSSRTKVDVIVTFLALLELVKQRAVAVVQEGTFDDIVVKRAATDQTNIIE